ncbi:Uncharacterised protein [Klebsiella michiganensis]|uniref:hypothetical protein n=1 Tax=Klebsiella michiganensis TaxID=1134687 RepID=UPI0007CC9440|nr:hypothetical protein [Klebsiella michiganensis]SAQ11509.1 Uncharacterised protein [Klebsiella michiganensis]
MQLKILGVGNSPLLSASIKNLDLDGDAGLINWSAVCRKLGVKRSTFLSKCAAVGLDQAFLAACNAGNSASKTRTKH